MDYKGQYIELVNNSPLCIHEIDLDAKLTAMNQAGLKMLGLKQECDVKGVLYFSAIGDKHRARIEKAFKKALIGETVEFEF